MDPLHKDFTDFLFFITDFFCLALLGFAVLSFVLEPRPVRWGPRWLTISLAGLVIASWISVLNSADPALSVYHAFRFLVVFGLYLYILNEITDLRFLLLPISIQVFLQSVIGISQALAQRSVGLARFGEYALDPQWSGISIVWADGTRLLRAYGLTDHPNILGGILALGIFFLLSFGIAYRRTKSVLWFGVFSSGLLGLFVTFSRSAWLALGVSIVWLFALFLYRRYIVEIRRTAVVLCAALIVLLPFAYFYAPYMGVRLNLGDSFQTVPYEIQSIGERSLLIQSTIQIFREYPIFGVGVGALPLVMRQYFPVFPVHYHPAHLVLVDVAAEAGVLGAAFYLAVLVAPWAMMWRERRRLRFGLPLIGASGLLLGCLVIGVFDYYTWLNVPGRYLQWAIWGFWAVSFQLDVHTDER